jgi:hypothetical protein
MAGFQQSPNKSSRENQAGFKAGIKAGNKAEIKAGFKKDKEDVRESESTT